MSYTVNWDETVPANTESRRLGAQRIRETRTAVRERIGFDCPVVVSNYTVTLQDRIILVDATSGSITVTLPSATGIAGRTFEIVKIDSSSNTVTIQPVSVTLTAQYQRIEAISDGTNYKVNHMFASKAFEAGTANTAYTAVTANIVDTYTGIPNGSFEYDSDNDGIPDRWTRYLYPGGSAGYETTSPQHGSKAYYFTHPGGVGNGGGYLESDFIGVTGLNQYAITFIHWATAAGMKNQVLIQYFDKTKTYISETFVYNSVSNPTSPKYFVYFFTPPSNSRYIKVRLIGGYNDTNVAGTAYFDNVRVAVSNEISRTRLWRQTDVSTTSITYIDVASVTLYNVPYAVNIFLQAELKQSSVDYVAYQRFRIGSLYSNENSTSSTTYVTFNYLISGVTAGPTVTLYMQLKTGNSFYAAYGRKLDPSIYLL